MESCEKDVLLELPAVSTQDVLMAEKLKLLKQRGLKLQFGKPGNGGNDALELLEQVLQAARVLQLNEVKRAFLVFMAAVCVFQTEYYFLEDDERGRISFRNEMAALSLISSVLSCRDRDSEILQRVEKLVLEMLDDTVKEDDSTISLPCMREVEINLAEWAKRQGVKSNIFIADFEGYGRGAAAASDLKAGDLVLEIPSEVIISENVALDSDVGRVLSSTANIGPEMITLLWTIRERTDQNSKYAPYFASLPNSFRTGLSFGIEGLQAVEGCMVFDQIMQAKEHLRAQYDMLFPALSKSNSDMFPESLYTWENFLWASELWYSNSVKVGFPAGDVKTCLIPLLGLFNHSTNPHIIRYSKIDAATNSLKVYTLRPCKAGKQCFLSYGTLANSDFLCFYGFVLENNPYDKIPIELDLPESSSSPWKSALIERYDIGSSHMVRGRWLSNSCITKAGLPTKLLAALRIALMEEKEAENFSGDPRHSIVSPENEKSVMEAITSTLEALSLSLQESEEEGASTSWDVILASKFKESQLRILRSLYEPCSEIVGA